MKIRLLFALILLMGCKDTVAPLSGEIYVLQSISGNLLPAPYTPGILFRIHNDTMAFRGDGIGERRTKYDSFEGTTKLESTNFSYIKTGAQVEITFECLESAKPCLPPPHLTGTITSADLRITSSKIGNTPMIYTRLAGAIIAGPAR